DKWSMPHRQDLVMRRHHARGGTNRVGRISRLFGRGALVRSPLLVYVTVTVLHAIGAVARTYGWTKAIVLSREPEDADRSLAARRSAWSHLLDGFRRMMRLS